MAFEYVREHYGVPAEMGRVVTINGHRGIIAADRGHYIGVNLDSDKPGVICNAHPTANVVYGEIGVVRKPKRTSRAYQEYLDAEYTESFAEWLRIEVPKVEWSGYGHRWYGVPEKHYRYVRQEFTRGYRWSPEIAGDWKPTKKEAKASYKEKLRAWKEREKKYHSETKEPA